MAQGRAFPRRLGGVTGAMLLAMGAAAAAPAGTDAPQQGAPSNANAAAPGGSGSAAGLAQKQGATAKPLGTPGVISIAPGIDLTLTYIGEAAGNPSGGLRQGAAYSGQVFGGLDFDMKTLAGIEGGAVHFAMVQRHGESDSALFIGNNTSVQEIYGQQKNRLIVFSYEQKLANGRVDLEVGRIGGNDAFLTSPLYCDFQSNAVCGSPVYIFQVSNLTAFPASGWGGRAKVFLTDKIFVHAGAYEANPENTAPNDVGFDWGSTRGTGATIPYEIGYATDFTNDPLPRHYGIGGWLDVSKLADPLLDANGNPAVLTGQPYRMDFGRTGVYARFDQMVWRPDPDSRRGLTLFGLGFLSTSGRVQQDHSFEFGLLQLGTLPGRDLDTIGFAVNEKRFSSLFVDNILAARASVGAFAGVPREEVMFELNYGLQLDDAIRLTPNLQYVLNPDQASHPFSTRNTPNAFVIGGRLAVDFSALEPAPVTP